MPSGKQILLSVLTELSQQRNDIEHAECSDDRLQSALLFHRSTADETWGKVVNMSWLSQVGEDGRLIRKGIGLKKEEVFLSDIVEELIEDSQLPLSLKKRRPALSQKSYEDALETIWALLSALEKWEELCPVENDGELDLVERDRMLAGMLTKLKSYRTDPVAFAKGDYRNYNHDQMSDWMPIVTEFYKLDHADDPESLVLGAPASEEALDDLASDLGFVLPEEFRSFYREHDGFGTKQKDGGTEWFFAPSSEIPKLTEEMRDWFQETHPEMAARFVSFVDWGCGDSSGYLFAESGKQLEGVFTFEHESYEFEEEQDWREFLMPGSDSIRDFLVTLSSDQPS